nr:MAG TPA: hypothetical protein [Caudoviricetes sp.]
MSNTDTPSLLHAFQYETLDFGSGKQSLFSERLPLKLYTECLNIDTIETTDLITHKTIYDRIIPWSESDIDELISFLCKESPYFEALWNYC